MISYVTLHEKNPISENNSLMTPFLLCSYFRAHPTNTTSQNISGNGCMGRPPTSNWGGGVPPVPLDLRPCIGLIIAKDNNSKCQRSTNSLFNYIFHVKKMRRVISCNKRRFFS